MGLFRRSTAIDVSVSPTVAVPRQTVTATISGSLDRVRSARLDWGYTNFFRYHWAGHADSAAAQVNDDLWLLGEVGTNYGGDRDTEEWVSVTAADLPIATGELRPPGLMISGSRRGHHPRLGDRAVVMPVDGRPRRT